MAQGQRAKGEGAEDVELVGGLSRAGRQDHTVGGRPYKVEAEWDGWLTRGWSSWGKELVQR